MEAPCGQPADTRYRCPPVWNTPTRRADRRRTRTRRRRRTSKTTTRGSSSISSAGDGGKPRGVDVGRTRTIPTPHDLCRHADHGRVRRHVIDDDRIRADARVITDLDGSKKPGARADEDAVANQRRVPALGSDGHLVLDADVASAADASVDHDAGRVDQHEAGPELRTAADDAVVDDRVQLVERELQHPETSAAGPLHEPIQHHRGRPVGRQRLEHGATVRRLVVPRGLCAEVAHDERREAVPRFAAHGCIPPAIAHSGVRAATLRRAFTTCWRTSMSSVAAASIDTGTKRRAIRLRAVNACAMPSASASGSSAWTNRSMSGSAISGTPPTRDATNGVPDAIDSSSTFGTPSDRLGRTVTSTARYQSARSLWRT